MTSDETGMVAIFQSTLPREERHWWMAVWWRIFEFQSTLPREERPKWLVTLPPWLNFNPRSHERSDNIQNLTFALTKRFQSTLPREERHVLDIYIYMICVYFNPRSHERSDEKSNPTTWETGNFNPRSHERSDKDTDRLVDEFMNFNPRSHERSDRNAALSLRSFSLISIHAPTRGATQ